MKRTFEFGNTDWYDTTSFLFASDDPKESVSTNEIIDTFKSYYDKFQKRNSSNPLNNTIQKLIRKQTLAELMFGNEGGTRISYEPYHSKRKLFSELLRSFSQPQQLEILRCFFMIGKYKQGIDSDALKEYIDSSNDFNGLIAQYESLLESASSDSKLKRNILNNLLRDLEPLRDEIRKLNEEFDIIFYYANNFHIRHNNLEGKHQKDMIVKMSESDLSQAYDNLFSIIRVVWCFLQDKKLYNHIRGQKSTLEQLQKLKKEVES